MSLQKKIEMGNKDRGAKEIVAKLDRIGQELHTICEDLILKNKMCDGACEGCHLHLAIESIGIFLESRGWLNLVKHSKR